MPGTTISVFSEPDDFQAALGRGGSVELLVTDAGRFWARSSTVILDHLWLTLAVERLPRVAFVSLPPGLIRLLLPMEESNFVYGGVAAGTRTIITHHSGRGLHEQLRGLGQWRDIMLSKGTFDKYSRALTGAAIEFPSEARLWRPSGPALRRLTSLHAAATSVAERQPHRVARAEAVHGLEQELIEAMVHCLSEDAENPDDSRMDRRADVMARFEHIANAHPRQSLSVAQICGMLGVADRALRRYCHENLGMGPVRYLRLRRMQRVRRALRNPASGTTTVSEVVQQYGFGELGRFAVSYRALYGEAPSATLRRAKG